MTLTPELIERFGSGHDCTAEQFNNRIALYKQRIRGTHRQEDALRRLVVCATATSIDFEKRRRAKLVESVSTISAVQILREKA